MKRLASMLGALILAANLTGCDGAGPPPQPDNPESTWPDEVKEAEAAFQKKATENYEKSAKKKPSR